MCVSCPGLQKEDKKARQEQNPVPQPQLSDPAALQDTLPCNKKSTWSHHSGVDIPARKIHENNANIFTFPDFQLLSEYIQTHYPGRDFPKRERQSLVFLLEMALSYRRPRCLKTPVYTWLKSIARSRRAWEERCKKK